MPKLLVIERMGRLPSPALSGVVGVDCFLPQRLFQLLERRALLAAQEDHTVAVAHDGVRVVLVNCFELTLRLQDEASRNLTAANKALYSQRSDPYFAATAGSLSANGGGEAA